MKKTVLFAVSAFFAVVAFTQKVPPEFGKIDVADLQSKACSFEPEAAAMKLLDLTESEVTFDQYNSTIKTQKRVRIKIFKESGYPYGTVRIFYPRKGVGYKIEDLKAVVYNLDESGKVVAQQLDKTDFFKNKANAYTGSINFTFPQLKPGSVVEYSYTQMLFDILNLDTWAVQDIIPVQYAANVIILPAGSRMKEKHFGADSVKQSLQLISDNRDKFTYYKENVPSFSLEPYMNSVRDNILRVAYFIPRTNTRLEALADPNVVWTIRGTQLLNSRYFIGQIATDIPGTDGLLKAAKKIEPVSARIQFLLQAVKKQAPDDPAQWFFPGDITEAWKNKNGSTAELNLILINLLRRAGVPCFPLLVSTRSHGNIRTDFPDMSQFNSMDVVAVDSAKVYILDASDKKQSFAVPPANVLNRMGLLLNDRIQWLQITDERPLMKQNTIVEASLGLDGNLSGHTTTVSYDYAKMELLDSATKEAGIEAMDKPAELKILNYKLSNSVNDDEPAKEEAEFEWNTQKTEGFYFVRPQIFAPMKKNPFLSNTRNTDVDFGCNQEMGLSFNVGVPPTVVAEFLPKDVVLTSTDSAFVYKRTCVQNATGISFTQSFQIKRSQFKKEHYPALREFFKKLYALSTEEIIFKKKS